MRGSVCFNGVAPRTSRTGRPATYGSSSLGTRCCRYFPQFEEIPRRKAPSPETPSTIPLRSWHSNKNSSPQGGLQAKLTQYKDALILYELYLNHLLTEHSAEISEIVKILVNHSKPP